MKYKGMATKNTSDQKARDASFKVENLRGIIKLNTESCYKELAEIAFSKKYFSNS
jgi:hypothetical protein